MPSVSRKNVRLASGPLFLWALTGHVSAAFKKQLDKQTVGKETSPFKPRQQYLWKGIGPQQCMSPGKMLYLLWVLHNSSVMTRMVLQHRNIFTCITLQCNLRSSTTLSCRFKRAPENVTSHIKLV